MVQLSTYLTQSPPRSTDFLSHSHLASDCLDYLPQISTIISSPAVYCMRPYHTQAYASRHPAAEPHLQPGWILKKCMISQFLISVQDLSIAPLSCRLNDSRPHSNDPESEWTRIIFDNWIDRNRVCSWITVMLVGHERDGGGGEWLNVIVTWNDDVGVFKRWIL